MMWTDKRSQPPPCRPRRAFHESRLSSVNKERSIIINPRTWEITPEDREAAVQNFTCTPRSLRPEAIHPVQPVDCSQQPLMFTGIPRDVRQFRSNLFQYFCPFHDPVCSKRRKRSW
jgi:hypothetical protein